ncbi:leukemia inhibitory factor receptor-like [Clinocottus analis]|uniref:leukemia inhibitory factor receptor-like n=1 Tax=Clinocottus analis TaxID=304258 RepID=UPI0035C15612
MMLTLLLALLFFKSTHEQGSLHCAPQNMTLSSFGQMLLLTWEDTPPCSAVQDVLIYELEVLIADHQVHYDEVAVAPEQIESTHSWNWTSYLALECASHSVRLGSRYKKQTSPWKQNRTLPWLKIAVKPEVFPKDGEFQVGSNVTFCCVLPAREVFKNMHLTGYKSENISAIPISSQTYALTVLLSQASGDSCTDVKCRTNTNENGACAYIGYPPDVRDLQCETRDLESVLCHWTVGRETDAQRPTVYRLLGSPCAKGRCLQKVKVDVGARNWTLTAQNTFGEVELSDIADLTKRVHMFPPKGVTASTLNARSVSLEWSWTEPHYNKLNITCQINVSNGENTTIEHFGVGLKFVVLNDLIPHWTYTVTVQCGTMQHFWKWSDWSTSVTFQTKGDVPDALDVWMQMKVNQILIIWKIPLANQSHGHITDYEVSWTPSTEGAPPHTATVDLHQHSLALSLDTTQEHTVTVTARNSNGSSNPSTITTPSLHPDINPVETRWLDGRAGGFQLSWSARPAASCGYIVDWCPSSGRGEVEWKRVPPNDTKTTISSSNLKDGVRYLLSLYSCSKEAPVLLERREGYVRQERIPDGLFQSLKGQQQESDVQVSWDPVPLREQPALIRGYVLYCLDNYNNVVSNFSSDDPEATSLTARNLQTRSYTFTVKAQTAAGEGGAASITVTLNSLTDYWIKAVFLSLVSVLALLSLVVTLCYRHWTCIKQKVYPPIPKPVMMSSGEHSRLPLLVDQCHHSETLIVDVLELHCSAEASVNTSASQEAVPQAPEGFHVPALRPPPFRSVFTNSSYNLILPRGDEKSSSGPAGFQPRGHEDTSSVDQRAEDAGIADHYTPNNQT